MDDIKANPEKDSVATKFKDVLREWRQSADPETCTWGSLVKAVENIPNRALAKRIKKREDCKEKEKGSKLMPGRILKPSFGKGL